MFKVGIEQKIKWKVYRFQRYCSEKDSEKNVGVDFVIKNHPTVCFSAMVALSKQNANVYQISQNWRQWKNEVLRLDLQSYAKNT